MYYLLETYCGIISRYVFFIYELDFNSLFLYTLLKRALLHCVLKHTFYITVMKI